MSCPCHDHLKGSGKYDGECGDHLKGHNRDIVMATVVTI